MLSSFCAVCSPSSCLEAGTMLPVTATQTPEEESPRKVQKTFLGHSGTPGPSSRTPLWSSEVGNQFTLSSRNHCFQIRWCSHMNPISRWHNSPSRWEKRERFTMICHHKCNIKSTNEQSEDPGKYEQEGWQSRCHWKSMTHGTSW